MKELVRLNENNYHLLIEMMDEWAKANEIIVPRAISLIDYHLYDQYVKSLDKEETTIYAPSKVFFLYDSDIDKFVGAVDIRLKLNERLLLDGGHIGDGIRPSMRRKGYGNTIVKLAINKCFELGIYEVLMVCNKDNLASRKTIVNNGGVLENEIIVDGEIVQRFWIKNI